MRRSPLISIVSDADSPRNRFRRVLDALFGEAWELERRRRRRGLMIVLGCCIAAVVGLALSRIPDGLRPAGATARAGQVTLIRHRLPLSTDFTGLTVVGGQLILSAYGNSAPQAANGGICDTAVVDPRMLRLGSITRGACDNPALFHRRVMEIDQYNREGLAQTRVATVDRNAKSGYSLGPVLVSHEECSDCSEESIYGPRSLWIYAPFPTPDTRNRKGELFRISELTGRVLERWAMPSITRALLASDADGLWLTASLDGGGPGVLYHVSPGMHTPATALRYDARTNVGIPARFLIAEKHTVWLESFTAVGSAEHAWLWRLDGTRVTEHGRAMHGADACGDSGEGPSTVLGKASTGFYCVTIGNWRNGEGATTQDVYRVVPTAGKEQRVATVIPPVETVDVYAAATLGNSYYFLDPQTETQGEPDEFYGSTRQPIPNYRHAGILERVTAA